jgi:hypothetical protein
MGREPSLKAVELDGRLWQILQVLSAASDGRKRQRQDVEGLFTS